MKLTQTNLPGKNNKRRKIRHYVYNAATVSTLFIGTQHLFVEVNAGSTFGKEREGSNRGSPRLTQGKGKETRLERLVEEG